MEEQNIPFMDNVKLHWIIIGVVFSIPLVIYYAIENPTSTVAMALFIEPSYTKVQKGYKLIDDFKSYDSLEEVTYELKQKGIEYTITAKNLVGDNKRKLYVLQTLEVRGYDYGDYRGKLFIVFFNDRLSHVIFYPYDAQGFKQYLESTLKKPLKLHETKNLNLFVQLKWGSDPEQSVFFRWEDRRLVTEELAWQMRHS